MFYVPETRGSELVILNMCLNMYYDVYFMNAYINTYKECVSSRNEADIMCAKFQAFKIIISENTKYFLGPAFWERPDSACAVVTVAFFQCASFA